MTMMDDTIQKSERKKFYERSTLNVLKRDASVSTSTLAKVVAKVSIALSFMILVLLRKMRNTYTGTLVLLLRPHRFFESHRSPYVPLEAEAQVATDPEQHARHH